jgi:hypothetical protein
MRTWSVSPGLFPPRERSTPSKKGVNLEVKKRNHRTSLAFWRRPRERVFVNATPSWTAADVPHLCRSDRLRPAGRLRHRILAHVPGTLWTVRPTRTYVAQPQPHLSPPRPHCLSLLLRPSPLHHLCSLTSRASSLFRPAPASPRRAPQPQPLRGVGPDLLRSWMSRRT